MKNLQDIAAIFFIVAIFILSVISILGIWDFIEQDVISKSFQTLGLLSVASVVVMVSGRFIDQKNDSFQSFPNPIFKSIRHLTIGLLITSAAVLALVGVLAIWEFISDKDVLFKSFGSLAVVAFSGFVVILTSLASEGKEISKNSDRVISGKLIFLILAAIFIFLPLIVTQFIY